MSSNNVRTGFTSNWFRTNVDVMEPKEIGFVHPPRKWQSECFNYLGSSNPSSIISSPMGSGKSTTICMIAYNRLKEDSNKKSIISCPENLIGKGFGEKVFSLPNGEIVDWSAEKNLILDKKQTVEQVLEFIKEDIFYSKYYTNSRICVCTNQTLVKAFNSLSDEEKLIHWKNLIILFDEAHHIKMDKKGNEIYEMNELAQVLDYSFDNGNEIVLMTASLFRGDKKGILSDKILNNSLKYNLSFYDYWAEMKYLECLKYDFVVGVNKYTEDIKDAFTILSEHNLSKQIIFIPMPQARMSTGKDGKYQEIQDIIEQKRIELDGVIKFNSVTGIYHIVNDSGLNYKIADLVTESYRAKVEKYIEKSDINKNRDAVDCIIAMNKANEGFDWVHADGMIIVGVRHSTTRLFQMIGRLLRDVPNKPIVKVVHMLDFAPHLPASPNLESNLNDCLKFLYATFLLLDVIAPSQVQTNDLSVPTGQLTNNVRQPYSNIFDDLEIDLSQRNDLVEKSYKKLASKFLEGHRDGFKDLLPEIVESWLVDNDIEASKEDIEKLADKVWKIIPSSSQVGLDLSDVNIKLLEAVGPLGFLMRFAGFDITKDALKDSLCQFSALLNQGESITNEICHKVCQWIVENQGRIPSHSSNDKDIAFMGKWIHHQKENKYGLSLGKWYPSNENIAETVYGIKNLFDKIDYETLQVINIEDILAWYMKNNKVPSPYSSDQEEKSLGKIRYDIIFSLNNDYGIKIYEKAKLLILDNKYNFLFQQINLLEKQEKRCHDVCKKIIDNNGKVPTSRSKNIDDKKDATWISTMKRCKKLESSGEIDNDGNRWYPILQTIAESYGLNELFEYVDLEKNCLKNAKEYVDFLIINDGKEPNFDSNEEERKIATWKKTYCKALQGKVGIVYNSVNNFLESKNVFDNFLSHKQKQRMKCIKLCDFVFSNQRLPKCRGKHLDEKKLYSWMNAQIKPNQTKQEYIDIIMEKNVQHFFEGLL